MKKPSRETWGARAANKANKARPFTGPRDVEARRKLLEAGLRFLGTFTGMQLLKEFGVPVEEHPDAINPFTRMSGQPAFGVQGDRMPGRTAPEAGRYWAPAWSVFIADAEMHDTTKRWLLTRCLKDQQACDAIDTVWRVNGEPGPSGRSNAQRQIEALLLEMWNPFESP